MNFEIFQDIQEVLLPEFLKFFLSFSLTWKEKEKRWTVHEIELKKTLTLKILEYLRIHMYKEFIYFLEKTYKFYRHFWKVF